MLKTRHSNYPVLFQNHLVGSVARYHLFIYPGDISRYENGMAEVRWEINPDGRFYCDEDGFGMTGDVQRTLYGAIDRKGKVVKKFTYSR